MSSVESSAEPSFKTTQRNFARQIREGGVSSEIAETFEAIEERRLKIYQELFYNNIESFISSTFPVLQEVTTVDRWHRMVRDFVLNHSSRTPYFLEISQEFLRYLQEERQSHPDANEDPGFMLELAHYEWVELALDVSTEQFPTCSSKEELEEEALLDTPLVVSPLCWQLSYQYPVHKISKDFMPTEMPETPTFILVYRNRQDTVGFMEINPATAQLIQYLGSEQNIGRGALNQLAKDLAIDDEGLSSFLEFGTRLLRDLLTKDIVFQQK